MYEIHFVLIDFYIFAIHSNEHVVVINYSVNLHFSDD